MKCWASWNWSSFIHDMVPSSSTKHFMSKLFVRLQWWKVQVEGGITIGGTRVRTLEDLQHLQWRWSQWDGVLGQWVGQVVQPCPWVQTGWLKHSHPTGVSWSVFGPEGLSFSAVSTSLDYRLLVCSIPAYLDLLFFSCSYRLCYLTAQFFLKPLFKDNKALVRGYMWLCSSPSSPASWCRHRCVCSLDACASVRQRLVRNNNVGGRGHLKDGRLVELVSIT